MMQAKLKATFNFYSFIYQIICVIEYTSMHKVNSFAKFYL